MTIKELYDWAVKNNVENFSIEYYDSDWGYTSIKEYSLSIEGSRVVAGS